MEREDQLSKELNKQTQEILEDLTYKSAFYCRLVCDLFKQTSKFKGKYERIFDLIGEVLENKYLLTNLTADRVTKIELAKVYMELEESRRMKKSNKLYALDDLFEE